MRRAILAVTLGGLLLTGTACDSDAETTAAPAPSIVPPSSAPVSLPPDYTADTRKICDKLEKVFDTDIPAFGTEIGKMITYKETKAPDEADKAEKAAGDRLKTVATKIRKETSVAKDPAIKTAGTVSAGKFVKAATDTKFFDTIKNQKDFDRVIEGELGEWLSPVAGYCA
jgi:hypothetical protein